MIQTSIFSIIGMECKIDRHVGTWKRNIIVGIESHKPQAVVE